MCLHYILPKDKRKQILDKIDREGIKVYKVAEVLSGMYFPIFMGITPYRGTMIADTEDKIIVGSHHCHWDLHGQPEVYSSGFHFFKTKAAAQRFCDEVISYRPFLQFKVISAIVKKSWVTEIGTEARYGKNENGVYSSGNQEIVIVAKKAIFSEKNNEDNKLQNL